MEKDNKYYVVSFLDIEHIPNACKRVRFDSWKELIETRTSDTNELVFPKVKQWQFDHGIYRTKEYIIFEFTK